MLLCCRTLVRLSNRPVPASPHTTVEPGEHDIKVILVNPVSSAPKTGFAPHLGLAYLAAMLESQGHEVQHFEASLSSLDDLGSHPRGKVDLIGITATSYTIPDAVSVARDLRRRFPDVPVVVGGPHVSIAREAVLAGNRVFDFAVLGEGEETLIELVRALAGDRDRETLSRINGLLFRADGQVVSNPPRPWNTKLDELPFPVFDKSLMDRYTQYPLITSRGCPYNCVYCASSVVWGRQWRPRSPENIVDEIEHAVREYAWSDKPFIVSDDTFNLDISRSKRFCELLIERGLGIRYMIQGFRADRVDEELARSLKRSGCEAVAIGIESANAEVLKNIRKGMRVDDMARGIGLLKEASLPVLGQFMIGNPGDTLETVKESIAFAKKTGLDAVNFYLALPYPKTDLWDYARQNGRFLTTELTTIHHYSGKPSFETPDFTEADRARAYRMAQRFCNRRRVVSGIRRTVKRIGTGQIRLGHLRHLLRRSLTAAGDLFSSRSQKW